MNQGVLWDKYLFIGTGNMTEEKTEDKLKVVRLEIDPDLHQAFKLECVASGVSMKDKIIQMMRDFSAGKKG